MTPLYILEIQEQIRIIGWILIVLCMIILWNSINIYKIQSIKNKSLK